ncbi:hypothetical protein [Funiculus sociatus]|uniref:hypothetical protein n=1 Tax=Funiculus sociatus TaxID=450527 RepID=UPI003299F443
MKRSDDGNHSNYFRSVDIHQKQLQQMQRQHGNLLVFESVSGKGSDFFTKLLLPFFA